MPLKKEEHDKVIKRTKESLSAIRDLKVRLKGKVKDVHINYDPEFDSELSRAVKALFGEEKDSKTEPGKKMIDMEMYIEINNMIHQAGKAQAAEFVKDKIFG